MKQFHHLLQRYYKKRGNKLVFTNGSTLNQLALQMAEDLSFSGVDASVVSRVINGQKLFTQKQLASFCRVLELGIIDQIELQHCLVFTKVTTLDQSFLTSFSQDLEDITHYPKIIRLLRKKGYPVETIETANFFNRSF